MFRCSRRAHAQVHIADDAADGVPFAHGSLFGEDSLYVKNNGQRYAYNFVGSFEQKVVATEDRPTAENLILAASFDKDGQDSPGVAAGILSAVRAISHNT